MLTKDRLVRLCRAREQLETIGEDEPSIAAVARAAAMSRYHFTRQFGLVFGETPNQFRTRVRLERAKHLLVHGQASVTEICLSVGYSSLGSFSALFAQRFGRPPREFREHLAAHPQELTIDCMTLLRRAWARRSANLEKPSSTQAG